MWRPREENTLADSLANYALDNGNLSEAYDHGVRKMAEHMVRSCADGFVHASGWIWARFDGAARTEGSSGQGQASFGVAIDWIEQNDRTPIFREGFRVGITTAQMAELQGAARATQVLVSLFGRLSVLGL